MKIFGVPIYNPEEYVFKKNDIISQKFILQRRINTYG